MRLDIGHKLGPGPVFPHLFMHAVDITQNRFGIDDIFTVHHQFNPEHAMGRRMLRPQVEDKGFLIYILLQ